MRTGRNRTGRRPGCFSDIMADALKIEVDAVVAQALGR
jgi:hypothetical protein